MKRAVDAVWNPGTALEFDKLCEQAAANVEVEAANCDRDILTSLKGQLQDLQSIKPTLKHIEDGVEDIWSFLKQTEREELLKWTSPVPYVSNHDTAKEFRTKHTCRWVFHCSSYQEWKNSSDSKILWLYGIRMLSPPNYLAKGLIHLQLGPGKQN